MSSASVKLFCSLVLASVPAMTSASGGGIGMFAEMPAWSEVEEVQRAAEKAGSPDYISHGSRWIMAPEGRHAMVMELPEDSDIPRSAMLGSYRREGQWLVIEYKGHAIDLASLNEEQRIEYEAFQAASEAEMEAAVAEIEAELGDVEMTDDADADAAVVDAEAEAELEAEMAQAMHRRYLIVPYRGGEVLLDEAMLADTAARWKGEGPLHLMPAAWRVPGMDQPTNFKQPMPEFVVDHPLQAGLPWDLARLLRRDAIEARVVEVLETPDTLVWSHHRAKVQLRLDRGERDGLYVGMDVYGLPPDEGVFAALTEVHADTAIATLDLQRFSPQDEVQLPTRGIRLTTRRAGTIGCSIDTSAAVRGKVLRVATEPADLAWDDEGFAFVELELDQGRAQDLAVGDELHGEDYELDGEGRVRSVQPDRSTVLWRIQRYHEGQELNLPTAGAALITPAWRRAEWDVFGDTAK